MIVIDKPHTPVPALIGDIDGGEVFSFYHSKGPYYVKLDPSTLRPYDESWCYYSNLESGKVYRIRENRIVILKHGKVTIEG